MQERNQDLQNPIIDEKIYYLFLTVIDKLKRKLTVKKNIPVKTVYGEYLQIYIKREYLEEIRIGYEELKSGRILLIEKCLEQDFEYDCVIIVIPTQVEVVFV